jgi:NAD(P)-dependent dehydrogenase (short-subunit alcohol dehydrogenase family)
MGANSAYDLPLADRHAVVTGGGKGIGAEIARELRRLGADVSLLGRTEATLKAVAAELGGKSGYVVCDLTEPDAVSAAMATTREARGPVQILINNAGVAASAPLTKTSLEDWNRTFALNATGPFLCAREVVPDMRAVSFGRIVTVASTAGLQGYLYTTAYVASKHAAVGFTRALALELARTGITVNAVCPGFTETDILRDTIDNIVAKTERSAEQASAELAANNPQNRLIDPAEVARVVGFLCLPSSGGLNGLALPVDGGEVVA